MGGAEVLRVAIRVPRRRDERVHGVLVVPRGLLRSKSQLVHLFLVSAGLVLFFSSSSLRRCFWCPLFFWLGFFSLSSTPYLSLQVPTATRRLYGYLYCLVSPLLSYTAVTARLTGATRSSFASGGGAGVKIYYTIEIMQYTDTRPLRPGEPGEQAEAYTQEKQALRRDSGPKGWIRGPDREKKKDRREPKRN